MVLPEGDHAAKQIWTAQEGTVSWSNAAKDDVIATAGSGVTAVVFKFFGGEARQAGFFVDGIGDSFQFAPVACRRNVDFNDSGIRSDFQFVQARIIRRRVAFHPNGNIQVGTGVFDGGDQIQIIRQARGRRKENMHASVARFNT